MLKVFSATYFIVSQLLLLLNIRNSNKTYWHTVINLEKYFTYQKQRSYFLVISQVSASCIKYPQEHLKSTNCPLFGVVVGKTSRCLRL